ncbi:JmjC domain-containing protein [Streptomyces sp. NPDC048448]|uniref:JmjC domain-containing protein n=2 Tax=Streptomyces TaxID=1883 RepID=UPI00341A40DE
MNAFERCVVDRDTFFAGQWRKAPAVMRPANPPVDLLTVADVDRLLDSGLLHVPYVEVTHESGAVPRERYCTAREVAGTMAAGYVDAGAVRHLIREEHATLLLRHVDQWVAGVRAFTDELAEHFGRKVEAFCFVTPAGTQGRPVHRDDADVLAVQVSGVKRWKVYSGPADGNWEPGLVAEDPGEPLLDSVLRAGEVLYVPRGFAHAAAAAEDASSVHLSFTIREAGTPNLDAVLQALVAADARLPVRPLDEESLVRAASEVIAGARKVLEDLTPEALVHYTRTVMRARSAEPTHTSIAD